MIRTTTSNAVFILFSFHATVLSAFMLPLNPLKTVSMHQIPCGIFQFYPHPSFAISSKKHAIESINESTQSDQHLRPPMVPVSFSEALRGINSKDSIRFLHDMVEATNSTTFQLFKRPFPRFYVVGNVQATRNILLEDSTSKIPYIYKTYDQITGARSLFSTGDFDKRLKTLKDSLTKPVFHQPNEVNRMNKNFEGYATKWLENKLDMLAETGKPFDLTEEMECLFFCSYMESAFEYKANVVDYRAWASNLKKILPELMLKRGISPLRKYYDFLSPKTREAQRACKGIQAFGYKVLQSYNRKDVEERSKATTLIKTISDKTAPYENDKFRVSQIIDLTIASYITSASLTSSVILLMAKHPDVAAKLQKELTKSKEKSVTSNSSYLRNVIKEVCRMHGPGSSLTSLRTLGKDFHIYESSTPDKPIFTLPKGSSVLIPNYLMCRDPHTFEDPDAYVPERWEDTNKDMEDSLLLFSMGRRRCPGQGLASVQVYFILEKMLSNFAFEIQEEGNFEFNGLLSAFRGARLRTKKRNS